MRAAKDEAKRIVVQNFPHLFRNSDLQNFNEGNFPSHQLFQLSVIWGLRLNFNLEDMHYNMTWQRSVLCAIISSIVVGIRVLRTDSNLADIKNNKNPA